jgi:hypothetical protein
VSLSSSLDSPSVSPKGESFAGGDARPWGWEFAKSWWLVALVSLYVPLEALRKGVDTYYDFLNIKWAMGWMLANGDFDLKGIASTRKWGPPFLDIWNAAWSTVGPWWLPNVVHGLAHLLIVPSVFVLAQRVAPRAPNLIHQVVAALAVLVPLVRMQIGTSTGHLYAALPLIWSLTLLVGSRQRTDLGGRNSAFSRGTRWSPAWTAVGKEVWTRLFLAGALLALSPLLKPSVLSTIPAHLFAAAILVGSVSGTVVFALGFAATYLAGAIGWASIVAVATTGSPLDVQSPGIPIVGPSLIVITFVVLALALMSLRATSGRFRLPTKFDAHPAALLGLTLAIVVISQAFASYLRRAVPDYRWLIPDFAGLRDRLFHAGDLQFGYLTLDLESAYFDSSIPLAMVLLGGAILLLPLMLARGGDKQLQLALGVVIFITYPLLYNMWATGYTRYASQVVPLVGVAGLALFSLVNARVLRMLGSLTVVAILSLPMLLTNRVSAEVPRFGQVAYDEPIYEDFVLIGEIALLNDLLPDRATVLAIGTINTYLVPQLGRDDLDWWFWKPKPDEVARMNGDIIFLFNPGDSDQLSEYLDQGLLYDDCSVLRFRRTSVGLCIGSVHPAVRSEALGST